MDKHLKWLLSIRKKPLDFVENLNEKGVIRVRDEYDAVGMQR